MALLWRVQALVHTGSVWGRERKGSSTCLRRGCLAGQLATCLNPWCLVFTGKSVLPATEGRPRRGSECAHGAPTAVGSRGPGSGLGWVTAGWSPGLGRVSVQPSKVPTGLGDRGRCDTSVCPSEKRALLCHSAAVVPALCAESSGAGGGLPSGQCQGQRGRKDIPASSFRLFSAWPCLPARSHSRLCLRRSGFVLQKGVWAANALRHPLCPAVCVSQVLGRSRPLEGFFLPPPGRRGLSVAWQSPPLHPGWKQRNDSLHVRSAWACTPAGANELARCEQRLRAQCRGASRRALHPVSGSSR